MAKRAWMEELESKPDLQTPPAFKVAAEPGWRLVWMVVRERRPDVKSLHCELAIGVHAITYWGFDAPHVRPGVPGLAPESNLGMPATMTPLHGDDGRRLVGGARVFAIVPPTDARTEQELIDECIAHMDEATLAGRRR